MDVFYLDMAIYYTVTKSVRPFCMRTKNSKSLSKTL